MVEPLGIELVFVVCVVELDIADQTIGLLDRQFEIARTDTFADGRVRAKARANSWVKAGGVSISAQMATQIGHDRKQHSQHRARMPRPYRVQC